MTQRVAKAGSTMRCVRTGQRIASVSADRTAHLDQVGRASHERANCEERDGEAKQFGFHEMSD
eukprot:3113279-Rhodomonas_salina.1